MPPTPGAGTTAAAQAVAVFAPTQADAAITNRILYDAGIPLVTHRSLDSLVDAVEEGVGAVVLLYECLASPVQARLETVLMREPTWSSVPFIVLIRPGTRPRHADSRLHSLKNAVLLERPVTVAALVSAIRAALSARARQYEIRDLLSAAQRASQERARLHTEADEARAAAESANRMKDEFLAVVSHELRTPLNAMLGWTTLLKRGGLEGARAAQALESIERNAKAQARLIEDLLDVSRIISGTLRLDVQQIDLVPIIEQALATVAPAADSKGLRIGKVFDPDAGPLSGDPARLQQVVWNLLSNAVKFTPQGGRIEVALQKIDSHVQIRVSDTGRGIAPEFLQQIFERFRQVDSSTTRTHGGLGLGLSIVRQLVELHGGSVMAESVGEGHGSVFIVRLPLTVLPRRSDLPVCPEVSAQVAAIRPPARALVGLRILVIDDEADCVRLLAAAFEDHQAKVVTANSAHSGLEAFAREPVDVLVCDIGMPQEDGYSLIRKVRALEASNGRWTPAIALTAYARAEDRLRTLAAGFQVHLAKPVDPLDLVVLIASLSKASRADAKLDP